MELFCTFIKMSLRWLPTRFDTDLTDMKPTARYAVFGHPIAHSRSPEIHLAFAKQEGVHISYEKMLLPLDGFTTGVRAQIDLGLQGANVTVPHKELVAGLDVYVSDAFGVAHRPNASVTEAPAAAPAKG